MVKDMFGNIVQGYLKKGYNLATAKMMAREFFRYEGLKNKMKKVVALLVLVRYNYVQVMKSFNV